MTSALLQLPLLLLLLAPMAALASDADPLQDFCVADLLNAGVRVNGYPCKNPVSVTAHDFHYEALAKRADLTGNPFNATATLALARNWPALNTQGLSLVRLDLNPGGVIMPHTHNRATEILYCLEGEIYTGFVTNSDNVDAPNKLYAKVVKKGEAFIFPRGLLHFQINKGSERAVSINVLNSQNPGVQLLPVSLFGAEPRIDTDVLTKSFFIDAPEVQSLTAVLSQFSHFFA